jgi:hypothetical protein
VFLLQFNYTINGAVYQPETPVFQGFLAFLTEIFIGGDNFMFLTHLLSFLIKIRKFRGESYLLL